MADMYYIGVGLSAIVYGSISLLPHLGWRFSFLTLLSGIVFLVYGIKSGDI